MRALRFIRLWRKLSWTMRDLDRALTSLGVALTDPIDDGVLTQLSHIQRLHALFPPIGYRLKFKSVDTKLY